MAQTSKPILDPSIQVWLATSEVWLRRLPATAETVGDDDVLAAFPSAATGPVATAELVTQRDRDTGRIGPGTVSD
jgi:hypothetical protein